MASRRLALRFLEGPFRFLEVEEGWLPPALFAVAEATEVVMDGPVGPGEVTGFPVIKVLDEPVGSRVAIGFPMTESFLNLLSMQNGPQLVAAIYVRNCNVFKKGAPWLSMKQGVPREG